MPRLTIQKENKYMSSMADPMMALLSFQEALNTGMVVKRLDAHYVERCDEIFGGIRYSYARVINGEVQALATFGPEEPINDIECYSVNYVVSDKYRGRGLSVEAVNKGIEELKKEFSLTKMQRFYVEAIIDIANDHSIKIAEKLFSDSGELIIETYSGKPALQFKRLFDLQLS